MMNYQDLKKDVFLRENQDKSSFDKKIIRTNFQVVGLYKKDIDNIRKKYASINLSLIPNENIYELNYLYLIIGLNQLNTFDDQLSFFENSLDRIDCWALVDSPSTYFKKVPLVKLLEKCTYLVKKDNTWLKRLGFVLLMRLKEDNKLVKESLSLFQNFDDYYVNMAEAWTLSTFCIYQENLILDYLSRCSLSLDIKVKTINKCLDSFRIGAETKKKLRTLKNLFKNSSVVNK